MTLRNKIHDILLDYMSDNEAWDISDTIMNDIRNYKDDAYNDAIDDIISLVKDANSIQDAVYLIQKFIISYKAER
jgi:hypothetical protein